MRYPAFRNVLLGVGSLATAFLLASCGGGGGGNTGSSSAAQGGILQVANGTAPSTAFAGVPFTLTIVGGKAPYTLISGEPGIFPLPNQTNSNFVTVIPANPGVVDADLKPEELRVRSVNVTVRDSSTQTSETVIKVAQNFLTGYGIALTRTTCPAVGSVASTTITTACAGGETLLQIGAVFNGALNGNKPFRLIVMRGNFTLRTFDTAQNGTTVTTTSDHSGTVTAMIQVPAGAATQIAIVRVQDVATGVYTDEAFVITGQTGTATNGGTLTATPTDLTFTGALSTQCGTGASDVLIFDGTPPYTALNVDPQDISVKPTTSNDNPGRFTITALNQNICLDKSPIVFTDAANRRVTVNVTTKPGSTAPPTPAAFDVQPTTVTVGCGQTATLSVVGGSGLYTANSTHPRLIAFTFANSVGITRATGDAGGVFPTTGTVTVSDGTAIKPVTVTTPATCP